MAENTSIKMASIPPPIDGIDYVSPPDQIKPTCARDLLNYYIFDWGIRQVHKTVTFGTLAEAAGSMFPIDGTNSVTACFLIMTPTKAYRVIPSGPSTTNITGGAVITSSFWNFNHFNGYVFLFNGTNTPLRYTISSAAFGAAGWTGPATVSDLYQGWNYKKKQYAIQKNTAIIWFGADNAVTGAMTSEDVGPNLLYHGQLLFGTSWAYNQGLSNDELMVLVSETGEVLVYSGSFPGASNWELLGRATIPTPKGSKCFVKLGQDILIGTARGVISLKDVFAGRNEDAVYFSVSRNVNPLTLLNCEIAFNKNLPFLYFQNSQTGDFSTYVLNYERGAWSRLDSSFTSSARPAAMCWLRDGNTSDRLYFVLNDASGTIKYIVDNATDSTGVVHTWKTPFFGFGSLYKKVVKYIRATVRNFNATTTPSITLTAATQEMGEDEGVSESAPTQTTTDNRYYSIKVEGPPGEGVNLSYVFTKTGTGEINEINGCDIFYEEGGLD